MEVPIVPTVKRQTVNAMPRVLLVGPRPEPPFYGGVEKGVDLLLRTDLARRTGMRLFNTCRRRDPSRPLRERLRYQLGMIRALRRDLAGHPVDLVHVKTSTGINFHQNAIYALVARRAGLPVVLQIHDGKMAAFYEESTRWMRAWIRHVFLRATRILVLSSRWADWIASVTPKARVSIVPNGLGREELLCLNRDSGEARRTQAVFIGTGQDELDQEKGLEDLLAVLPEVSRHHPAAGWVLAGLGAPEIVQGRLAAANVTRGNPAGNVRCLGLIDPEQRVKLLQESSILLMPSYYENMPNLLLEAMAGGLGIIATSVGAIPEMLGQGEGGFLLEPGDRQALQAALSEALASPEKVERQGLRNRDATAREYTMDVVEERLEEIYLQAAGRRPSPAGADRSAPSAAGRDSMGRVGFSQAQGRVKP